MTSAVPPRKSRRLIVLDNFSPPRATPSHSFCAAYSSYRCRFDAIQHLIHSMLTSSHALKGGDSFCKTACLSLSRSLKTLVFMKEVRFMLYVIISGTCADHMLC